MERFTIEIEGGTDAMQTGADVAEALQRIVAVLAEMDRKTQIGGGRIRDLNGNTVGRWEVA